MRSATWTIERSSSPGRSPTGCEGAKNKPDRRYDRVVFTNSDPGLSMLFLRFLDAAGIGRDRLIYQVQIHESADVRTAQEFWLSVTGADPAQFRRPTLKRHNPRTVRTNTGEDYHGCLRIEVRRSTGLYRKIEGWAAASMRGDGHPNEVPSAWLAAGFNREAEPQELAEIWGLGLILGIVDCDLTIVFDLFH
jgi:hypothetical protein